MTTSSTDQTFSRLVEMGIFEYVEWRHDFGDYYRIALRTNGYDAAMMPSDLSHELGLDKLEIPRRLLHVRYCPISKAILEWRLANEC